MIANDMLTHEDAMKVNSLVRRRAKRSFADSELLKFVQECCSKASN